MLFKNKNNDDELKEEIKRLAEEVNDCKKQIESLKKTKKQTDEILKTNHDFFTTLFLDYDLKPRGILKNMQELSQELLDFAVNICNKHDLTYFISAGTLLGAYRHGGFIPWDDDIDMGLLRGDYEKFCEITPDEIRKNNAEDFITFKIHSMIKKDMISPFTKLQCLTPDNHLIAGTDITPYEFSTGNEFNVEEFRKYRNVIFKRMCGGDDMKTIIRDFYEKFNLSYDETDYIIKNPTYIRHALRYNKEVACWDKDKFLPVGTIEFNGKIYNCPNTPGYFLKADYDDYMKIPTVLKDHHYSVDKLRHVENLDEIYDDLIRKVRACNENFK